MAITLHKDNYTTDGSDREQIHGIQSVGNVSFLFHHPLLDALAADKADYKGVANGVYLTGFKLESTLLTVNQQIQNSKLIPLLNGDTMTLTNANKSGTISFNATRTAAGIVGGDIVAIADFIRTQGDSYGGELTVSWIMNGINRKMTFKKVTVQNVPALMLAGNDIPDYNVTFTFATYEDDDFPIN